MSSTFAQRILQSREKAGLSRRQVADAIGISTISVGYWERGENRSVKSAHLFKLARLLKVDAEWLANGEKFRPQKAA